MEVMMASFGIEVIGKAESKRRNWMRMGWNRCWRSWSWDETYLGYLRSDRVHEMKAAVYAELRETLLQNDERTLRAVREKYPWVQFDTVVAIKSQESSRQLRLQHHKFRGRQRIQEYITRWVLFRGSTLAWVNHCSAIVKFWIWHSAWSSVLSELSVVVLYWS
jgi:hypothetical protein